MTKPRLLDLFCGAGGASMGYHRAGFEVVGVDIDPQPYYPFEFYRRDAMTFPLDGFDAIHASPPCQSYSTMSNRHGSKQLELIPPVRERMMDTGLPYVIENVEGAKPHMVEAFRLTGEMFGLRTHRARYFETNVLMLIPNTPRRQKNAVAIYGKNDNRRLWTRKDGTELRVASSLEEAQEAMGMDWADWHGTKEAIPPAYTEFIGRQLIDFLERKADQ